MNRNHPYADVTHRKTEGGGASGLLTNGAESATLKDVPAGHHAVVTGFELKNRAGADAVTLTIKAGAVTLFTWTFAADEGLVCEGCYKYAKDFGAAAGDNLVIAVAGGTTGENLDYSVTWIIVAEEAA